MNLNQINNNRIININENNIKKIPKIHSCSQVFDNDYRAQRLFDNKSYYCSKYPNNQFIIFDYENEHFFKGFTFFYPETRYKSCRPKNYKITILDKDLSIINIFNFVNNDRYRITEKHELNSKGRYIRFDFIDNHGGEWIIIEKLEFDVDFILSIQ